MSETLCDNHEKNAKAEVQPVTAGREFDGDNDVVGSKETEAVTSEVTSVSNGKYQEQTELVLGSKQDDEEDTPQTTDMSQPVAKQLLNRKLRCFDPTDTVNIVVGDSGIQGIKPITIPQFLQRTCDKVPNGAALCWKDRKEDPWQSLTYVQYKKLIYNVAKSFLKLGLERYHAACILGFNSVEWFASSLGAVFAGGLSTGIYTTNSPEACHYILENSKANIVVVENQTQLDKILQVRDRLPHLKAIVQYKGELSKDYPDTYTWSKFLEIGKDTEDSIIDDIVAEQQPNQCAVLVYTSGTTGNPKGVMLSHDNIIWAAAANYSTVLGDNWKYGVDRFVSYLPLSHAVGKLIDIYFSAYVGGTVYFAQPDALKGTLGVTLKEVQPTFIFGVPRVYEKMKEKMEEVGRTITGFKKKVSTWARDIGLRGNRNIQNGLPVPWGWTLASMLVFKKVKEALGLRNCKVSMVGGAPTHQETLEFFMAVDITIQEMYGMSECSGATINLKSSTKWRTGSCGKAINGVEVKIDCPDECGDGEILIRGRNVFMGYLGMEEKTKETIDDEGWLHSGDIGRLDQDGFLYITGRIKELIITAGGVNIPPTYIEDCIKGEVPFISNVMVIGDKRKYLTCLKCVIDLDTQEATDDLQPQVIKMFQQLGSNCTTVSQVIESEDKAVFKAIQDGIDRYNTHQSISNAQKVQKWKLLDTDFTIPGGELGPTLKVKRPVVLKKYAETIESFYADS